MARTGVFKGLLFAAMVGASTLGYAQETPKAMHAVAMHGEPKYGADFTHFEYTNPDAPKGGEIRLAAAGTFDNLNPFIIKGVPAPGTAMIYQPLTSKSDDEAFTQYGQIAESVEMPDDRSFVVFNLRKDAKWSDGKPLTADDVVFTFNTLMKDGHPFYQAYYGSVKEAVAESPTRVKFTFKMAGNRELPLIMGEMQVLPKHYWEGKNFAATTLEKPIGSGPYKIKSIDTGKRIVYERVKNWWGENLPVNKGQYNFDTIVYDVYRDETVLLQALFAGEYDFRAENQAKAWHSEYNTIPVKEGWIKKDEIHHNLPSGMQGFIYNTRKTIFADALTRRALGYAFDFEWSNKQFAFGSYKRTNSYFDNSELAATGRPQGRELEILEKYRGKIPNEVFVDEFKSPVTNGTGSDMRDNLSTAKRLLAEAGWRMGAGKVLQRGADVLKFEILLSSPMFERWTAPFVANLKKLGAVVTVRSIDPTQYQNRMDGFDFDMTVGSFGQSLSPGNEQRDFWGSDKVNVKGSRNLIGIKDPIVDELIEQIITAKDREELVATTRALDRVLLWSYYLIPHWHIDYFRIAYWDKFGRPDITPKYGLGIPDNWWFDAKKAATVAERLKTLKKE